MTITAPTQPRTFAEAEKVLAERLPGYTPRPQQQALAAFVEDVIANGGHGLAEAGCGTGKSLATMIPAILGGRRTVVATATIALMEQYATKDVPFLQEHLGVPFTWALVKGRSNYFCRAKAAIADSSKVPALAAMLAEIDADPEHDGDREHFAAEVTKDEFSYVASTSSECPGKRDCPFGEICFAERAKEKGREAQVVVTNTAMLMTDLKVRELTDGNAAMLGDYDLVLIDEGHETEEIATNMLSEEIRYNGVVRLVTEATTFASSQNVTLTHTDAVRADLDRCWGLLDEGKKTLRFFVEHADPFIDLIEGLQALSQEIGAIKIVRGEARSEFTRNRLVKRALNTADRFEMAVTMDDELLVRWIETETDRRTRQEVKRFCMAPVHVGSYLSEWLWESTPSVLISATLSVGGDFSYISDRLGLPSATKSLNVGTPFDYTTQAMLFTPPASAPSPKDRSAWLTYTNMATRELVAAAGGGALLLFTSRSSMQAAYEGLAPIFEEMGFRCFIQGKGSNKEIAQAFAEDTHSVLFALKSFFTGVDFQGDTCRLVVIDKLPFPVPTDPVFAARADLIDRNGGSSFSNLTIPAMTLTLVQGYGRLIRTTADRGVVAILDSRLTSTGYGKKIVRGLPGSPQAHTFDEVKAFYA